VVKGAEISSGYKNVDEEFSVLLFMFQFNQEVLAHQEHTLENPILLLNVKGHMNEACLTTNFFAAKVVVLVVRRIPIHVQSLLSKLNCVEIGLVLRVIVLEEQVANTFTETLVMLVVISLAEVVASEETIVLFLIKSNLNPSLKFV